MKFLDKVEVVSDNANYNKNNVYKGMVGTIIDAEIRDNCFNVLFIDERVKDKKFMANEKNLLDLKDDIVYPIKIKDLKLAKSNNCDDATILDSIPQNNPNWWCKVEDGFIINLKGERKNKTPYKYDE